MRLNKEEEETLRTTDQCGGVAVEAFVMQSKHLVSIPLSSHIKDLKISYSQLLCLVLSAKVIMWKKAGDSLVMPLDM